MLLLAGLPRRRPCRQYAWARQRDPASPSDRHCPAPIVPLPALQAGCAGPTGLLAHQACALLAPHLAGPTVGLPEVAEQGPGVQVTGGFPVRLPAQLLTDPGFTNTPAQGVAGADIRCEGSVIPGRCAFALVPHATLACTHIPDCRSVTVYTTGESVVPVGVGKLVCLLRRAMGQLWRWPKLMLPLPRLLLPQASTDTPAPWPSFLQLACPPTTPSGPPPSTASLASAAPQQ